MEIFWKETTHNILNEGLTYNDLFQGLYVWIVLYVYEFQNQRQLCLITSIKNAKSSINRHLSEEV